MKRLFVTLFLTMSVSGAALAANQIVRPARVQALTQVGVEGDQRLYRIDYLLGCSENEVSPVVTTVPQHFMTEHVRHVVGVVVSDNGRRCLAADRRMSRVVRVPIGDVSDRDPIILQP